MTRSLPLAAHRLLRVVSVLLLGGAVLAWALPLTVPGRSRLPFGCGSALDPMAGQLAGQLCSDGLSGRRMLAVALLAAAAVALGVGEIGLARLGAGNAVIWATSAAAITVPLVAVAVWLALRPITLFSAEGAQNSCGTALAPSTDQFLKGICTHVPSIQLGTAVATALAGTVLGLGLAWILTGIAGPEDDPAGDNAADGLVPARGRGESVSVDRDEQVSAGSGAYADHARDREGDPGPVGGDLR